MRPDERRNAIIELLCQQRQETMKNLSLKFGVSIRTIRYDIEILSLTYPLGTLQGRHGGVYLMDGFRPTRKYLTSDQQALLERLRKNLSYEEQILMDSILSDFALVRR